jgi:hypothetical protein
LAKIGYANSLEWDIDVSRDVGIDRDEIILAIKLQSEPGKIDKRYSIRSSGGYLTQEFAECFPQCGLIEIRRAGDGEASGLQRLGD